MFKSLFPLSDQPNTHFT
uniref:Uncharacterized protein n=1 Tax=Rhizophora mucronata TaxID=61149 RepID=A0A2P2QK80_RHIMU